jgi:hypothetical protein
VVFRLVPALAFLCWQAVAAPLQLPGSHTLRLPKDQFSILESQASFGVRGYLVTFKETPRSPFLIRTELLTQNRGSENRLKAQLSLAQKHCESRPVLSQWVQDSRTPLGFYCRSQDSGTVLIVPASLGPDHQGVQALAMHVIAFGKTQSSSRAEDFVLKSWVKTR